MLFPSSNVISYRVQLVLCECATIAHMFVLTPIIYKSKMCSDLPRPPISWTGINLMATQTVEQIYNAYIRLHYAIVTCYFNPERIINKVVYEIRKDIDKSIHKVFHTCFPLNFKNRGVIQVKNFVFLIKAAILDGIQSIDKNLIK